MKEGFGKITRWITAVPRIYHLLAIAVIFILLVIIHYHESFTNISLLDRISSFLEFGLTRQTFGRILFLIPITYGAFVLGLGASISLLVLSLAAMLPRIWILSAAPREAIFETAGVVFTGILIVLLVDVLQKARQRLIDLEALRKMLDLQIERLSMLHTMSNYVSQSLKLDDVLSAVEMIKQLIKAKASWLYLWDEEQKQLHLAAAKGLPEKALPDTLSSGEGPDGKAAVSKEAIIVENASSESDGILAPWGKHDLKSMLVVPLIAKGEFVGTMGVGTRLAHHFSQDEVDLLRAVSDQLGMAVENARLYERERSTTEALRVSESNYRELFENASDAIWVHDLEGKFLAVNSAFERLTGYERGSLTNTDVSVLFSAHGQSTVDKEAHDIALRGGTPQSIEQELIKKDGSIAVIQIGTSLITKDEKPWAFQHTGRDITEEKKIQENLKYYVQKYTQAQEAERKRIARELHDVTAQALVMMVRNLGDIDSGHTRVSVKEIQEQARDILKEIRRFSQQLRPSVLDDLGLLPAVQWLASDLTKNYDINVSVNVVGEPHQLPSDAELTLFRITQEALNNVQKHSGASEVDITMEFAGHYTRVTVNDNGKGFEIPGRIGDMARIGKLGLAGMQERTQLLGGTLTIDSQPGKGTLLTIEVPSQTP